MDNIFFWFLSFILVVCVFTATNNVGVYQALNLCLYTSTFAVAWRIADFIYKKMNK